jgi:hypothetical protein
MFGPSALSLFIFVFQDDDKEGSGGQQLKRLRTFLPVMEHYCSSPSSVGGDTSSILRLFRQMQRSSGVHFDADTYAAIIGALARNGVFRNDAPPIPGALEAGFSVEKGPLLLDEIASEMALDIMELSEKAAQTIYQSLQQGFLKLDSNAVETSQENSNEEDDMVAVVVPTIQELSPAAATGRDGVLLGRVTIDDSTAICPSSGAKLRLLTLDDAQRKHVHDTLLTMAKLQHQEFIKNAKKKVTNDKSGEENDHGLKELSRFSEWME